MSASDQARSDPSAASQKEEADRMLQRQSLLSVAAAAVHVAVISSMAAAGPTIEWKTGHADLPPGSAYDAASNLLQVTSNGAHAIAQFARPLTAPERSDLASTGIQVLAPIGGNAYFVSRSTESTNPTDVANAVPIVAASEIQPNWKIHPLLLAGRTPRWAIVEGATRQDGEQNSTVGVYVQLHADVPIVPDGSDVVRLHGGIVRDQVKSVNTLVAELPVSAIARLATEDAVQWIEPALPRLSEVNDDNRHATGAEVAQAVPYGLDGAGVTVLVYDGGSARESHVDFGGRLSSEDDSGLSGHATHVACTIGGNGDASGGVFAGMAPAVQLVSFGFEFDGSGVFLYSNPGDLESDYLEAMTIHGADLANNSIGTNTCINGFSCEITGDYGVTAALIDTIVAGGLGNPFRIIWSNGNERSCSNCQTEHQTGYHSTAPPACAKNHVTVGAINSNDGSMTSFSSWGPTDDGRIKPDLVAPGCQSDDDFGVTSCSADSDTDYVAACGTSMAAPTVTGLAALLLQDFRDQYPTQSDPRNATLKAIMTHFATDHGAPGPDYQFGFGEVQIVPAIDGLRIGSFITRAVGHGESFPFLVRVGAGDTSLKVTLAWDDPAAVSNVANALVNDLDLQVIAPSGLPYYPWTLDPATPSLPAVRIEPDRVNNIEQVLVESPEQGLWLIYVHGFNVQFGPQLFSAVASPIPISDCDEDGIPDDHQIAADPTLDCGANGVLDDCEPDCDQDGVVDSCELISGSEFDCNTNAVPDSCEPNDDCNHNGVQDICDLANGPASDCNRNGVLDVCDLGTGESDDCNRNGIPDECESDDDCDENGVADICDIADGSSLDCNGNQVPDECDIYSCGSPAGSCPGSGDCCSPQGNGTPGCDCSRCCAAICQVDLFCCQVEWDELCAFLAVENSECPCQGGDPTGSFDCNQNSIPDECDIAEGDSEDCNNNARPDECDPQEDCNSNGVQDVCDVAVGTSDDCNQNEIPDECEPADDCNRNGIQDVCDLASGDSSDCNNNDAPDECDIDAGTSEDCNGNLMPDECEPDEDCNENNQQDICDIADATSADCNANGRPDECDIYECGTGVGACSGSGDCCAPQGNGTPGCECARCCKDVCATDPDCCIGAWDGFCSLIASASPACNCSGPFQDWSDDCNTNQTPDECDIADGTSEDCNANLVPDECDPQDDCNLNGIQDVCDVAFGTSQDCDDNDVPDECDADCNQTGLPDPCDIASGGSEDCNDNSVPDECDPQDDCNSNGIQDICDVAAGASPDCNLNGIPDECDPDCNGNGVTDECELAAPAEDAVDDCHEAGLACPGLVYEGSTLGATNDGNASCGASQSSADAWFLYIPGTDGTLTVSLCGSSFDTVLSLHDGCPGTLENQLVCDDDACGLASSVTWMVLAGRNYWIRIAGFFNSTGSFSMQLVGPECMATSLDCNSNLVPDECDLVDGTSEDCNDNDAPDECDKTLFTPTSPRYSPLDGTYSPTFEMTDPPIAHSNPLLIVSARGDLDHFFLEYINVSLNGCFLGRVFQTSGQHCPVEPNVGTITVDASDYNEKVESDGVIRLSFSPPASVSSDECLNSFLRFSLEMLTDGDCNGNYALDACEIEAGSAQDCNGNGRPDVCDLLSGDSGDCNSNFVPDECEADCNENGLADSCDLDTALSEDCDGNGVPDECDSDADLDGTIDACDACPLDYPDDTDDDGTCDSDDGCPLDPNKIAAGQCGCGLADLDDDGDGVANCNDQCPGVDDGVFAPDCFGRIPTTTTWGLTILALLLVLIAKLRALARDPRLSSRGICG